MTTLLDPATIERLRTLGARDVELLTDIVSLFDATTREDIARLVRAREADDAIAIEQAGHRLCGTAASAGAIAMGAIAMGAAARRLMEDARAGLALSEAALHSLCGLRDASCDAIRRELLG
jgi:HPt (histidine-containing phosphotransfer) domain-containing protein